jgi:hypothetical protein
MDGSDTGKYEVVLVLDEEGANSAEGVNLKKIVDAELAAMAKEQKCPVSSLKTAIRSNEERAEKNPVYKPGGYFLSAKSKFPPGLVDRAKRTITDRSAVYAGVEGRLVVSPYRYNVNGNRGVGLSLELVQITNGDKERIGAGGSSALNLLSDLPDPFAA